MSVQPPQIDSVNPAPLPIPNDLPPSAPMLNDIERGYPKTELINEFDDSGQERKGSVASGNDIVNGEKKKKHGSGLTEGDQGEWTCMHIMLMRADVAAIPDNNLLIVMPT